VAGKLEEVTGNLAFNGRDAPLRVLADWQIGPTSKSFEALLPARSRDA
jgi:hypothetical protein